MIPIGKALKARSEMFNEEEPASFSIHDYVDDVFKDEPVSNKEK